ncbi:hypothetical protein AGABI1DRAFT_86861, partial [Agaricus bisporus var. burnettii JB137-S8]
RNTSASDSVFKIPAPPPLRGGEPFVPLLLFAYPLPDDCLEKWAKIHNIPEGDENDLCQDAFDDIRRQRPPRGWCRVAQVYYDDWKVARALVIATNRSKEEMAQSQDLDLIQYYRDLLHSDPGWFRKFFC